MVHQATYKLQPAGGEICVVEIPIYLTVYIAGSLQVPITTTNSYLYIYNTLLVVYQSTCKLQLL